jgi:phospholipid/cholesterol/gamma-HCH transport system substrate-binding protein
MITSRTKKQLLVFVLITLVGVSFVGARYARLDRLFHDPTYQVTAHFTQSGGIFTTAEVTYRGVHAGEVSDMKLTKDGVDVVLSIDKDFDRIPADTTATVANKSAVGEQYVDLQPQTDSGPYLKDGSTIANSATAVPVSTTELLTNLDQLVNSVPQDSLRTVVTELGAAFHGTGDDLARLIDTSTSFIKTANDNLDTTTALIHDSRVVLQTQNSKASAIRAFSRDFELFSKTLAASDTDLRRLIDNGAATATELRTFLEQNQVDLGRLIANVVTTSRVVVKHLAGVRQILVLYPYAVAGGYTVAAPDAGNPNNYDARFGLVLQQDPPPCDKGYTGVTRTPDDRGDLPMNTDVHCAEPPTQSDPRGAQNAPIPPDANARSAPRAPVASYDRSSGQLTWTDEAPTVAGTGGQAALFGKDSWKWMLLQPALPTTEPTQQ